MKYGARKTKPAAIAPVKPVETSLGAATPPAGIITSEPTVKIDGEWSVKNKDWTERTDRTGLVKGDPKGGGELIAVYSHRDNMIVCGGIPKGQHGYVPALVYKWLHNFFTPLDQKDADKKVKKAEEEYSKL